MNVTNNQISVNLHNQSSYCVVKNKTFDGISRLLQIDSNFLEISGFLIFQVNLVTRKIAPTYIVNIPLDAHIYRQKIQQLRILCFSMYYLQKGYKYGSARLCDLLRMTFTQVTLSETIFRFSDSSISSFIPLSHFPFLHHFSRSYLIYSIRKCRQNS